MGLAEGATLPPCLQKSPAGRWPGTPPVRQRGGQEQICPPCQALSHGKVPAESGTAESGSSLCRSVTAWGRLRGAGRDRLASPSPFTRLRSKSAEMLRRGDGRVPSPACPQLHGTLPKSRRNLFPSLRGTHRHGARGPSSPPRGTLRDLPPHERLLLLSLVNSNPSSPSLPHGTATPAAAGPGQSASPCAQGRQRQSPPGSDPS